MVTNGTEVNKRNVLLVQVGHKIYHKYYITSQEKGIMNPTKETKASNTRILTLFPDGGLPRCTRTAVFAASELFAAA